MAGRQAPGLVLVVAGGKGGVGKTNLAVNLGIELSRHGLRTILLDADFGHANADILLGIAPQADLVGLLNPCRALEDVLSRGPEGLGVICGVSGLRHARSICETDPLLFVGTLLRLRRSCDVVVVDCSAEVTGAAAGFALACDRLILVTTPEPTAVADSYATVKLLFQRGFCAQAGVVVNMAQREADAVEASRRLQRVAQQFLGLSLENLGWVPFDKHVVTAVREQRPFVTGYPRCAASAGVARVARRLRLVGNQCREPVGVWGRVASL
ncbi:MAG: P-loop NTPase, partial [Planctomycetes bacterium]|nr:P-loop NTPase [Planctomycetota bacterium]